MKTLRILLLWLCMYSVVTSQTPAQNAILFDGNDDYINVPNSPSLQIEDTVTISAWAKRTRLDTIILEKGGDWNIGETNYGFSLHVINNKMFYFIFDGGWRGTTGVADTNWHHYAVVAIQGEADPQLFIDGVLKPVEYGEGLSTINLNHSSTRNLHLGVQLEAGATHYSSNIIDEVRLWNVARDSIQIRSTMNDTLGPEYYSTADSGLVGYWRLDTFEDLGVNSDGADDCRDLSSSLNHGDSEGNPVLVSSGALVGIEEISNPIPLQFTLRQNYPNPFNPATTIEYDLPRSGNVTLSVHNIVGQQIKILVNEFQTAGARTIVWDGRNHSEELVSSGIYFYRLQVNRDVQSRKMLLIK